MLHNSSDNSVVSTLKKKYLNNNNKIKSGYSFLSITSFLVIYNLPT